MNLKRFALRCGKCRKYLGYAEAIKKPVVYCDEKCGNSRKKGSLKRSDFELIGAPLSCGTKGAFAELLAAAILLSRGYDVYRSVSPNANCDLVIVRANLVLRVEVRNGQYKGKALHYGRKDQDRADFYAVYYLRDDKPSIAFIRNKNSSRGKVSKTKFLTPEDLTKKGERLYSPDFSL